MRVAVEPDTDEMAFLSCGVCEAVYRLSAYNLCLGYWMTEKRHTATVQETEVIPEQTVAWLEVQGNA